MRTVEELEDRLSQPGQELVDDMREIEGDIVVLGAAGKLGPSLIRLATRAVAEAGTGSRVIAVSRFSTPGSADEVRRAGAEVVEADITDDEQLAALPDADNVIYLVGAKFGTRGKESSTWATNAYLPGRIAQRYSGSRIAALSTGNVYPLSPIDSNGPQETDMVDPVGEYAMSCLGRERILEHFGQANETPISLLRLNYAVEMRYGVLVDIAQAIRSAEPVDVTTGYVNVVWQGYANEITLRSLRYAGVPPFVLNVTGSEIVSVRAAATEIAQHLGTTARFTGEEASTALLSNASLCHELFGYPHIAVPELIEDTANWVRLERPMLDKPTKFQSRNGQF